MNPPLMAPLLQATTATFEDLAMLVSEPAAEWPSEADPRVTSSVRFSGAHHGWLSLSVSAATLPSIAANMLGGMVADEQVQIDALGELANVICGNVLGELSRTEQGFSIDPPAREDAGVPDGDVVTCAWLRLDSGAAEARLYLAPAD